MVKEAYVSFEVAKLLKEKGFNIPVWTRYEDEEDKEVIFGDNYDWNNSPMGQISAPTLQMAMAWLREEKNCIISIWYTGVCYAADYYIEDDNEEIHDIIGTYNTYNEAVEESLKDVLTNLI